MRVRGATSVVVLALAAGCVNGGAEVVEPVPTLFDDSATTTIAPDESTTTASGPTTTVPVRDRLPGLPDDVVGAVAGEGGIVLPITGTDGEVWFLLGPCGEQRIEPVSTATLVGPHHVVLDPGGIDDEAGAVNLAVALRAAELLTAQGVVVTLTRTSMAQMSAATRAAVGPAVGALVMVSVERGTGDAVTADPRPTVFHRADDVDSRRLAGLIHHEVVDAFASLEGTFTAASEPGVRSLLNQRGDDYFRVLGTGVGVAAARVELLGPGPDETTLLASEEGRDVEAGALAEAVVRYLVTSEEGDGFIDPIESVRTAPTSDTPGGC